MIAPIKYIILEIYKESKKIAPILDIGWIDWENDKDTHTQIISDWGQKGVNKREWEIDRCREERIKQSCKVGKKSNIVEKKKYKNTTV